MLIQWLTLEAFVVGLHWGILPEYTAPPTEAKNKNVNSALCGHILMIIPCLLTTMYKPCTTLSCAIYYCVMFLPVEPQIAHMVVPFPTVVPMH